MDAAGSSFSQVDPFAARDSAVAGVAAWLDQDGGFMSAGDGASRLDEEDPSAWIADIAAHRSRESFALLFTRFAPRAPSFSR